MKSQVSITECRNYGPKEVRQAVNTAVDLLGGITKFIKPNSKVLVKPNLLLAKEPEYAIDTHPEVVRAVIEMLKQVNAKIFLGDSSSVWGAEREDQDLVYEKSGMRQIAEEESSVQLVKFNKRKWHEKFPLTFWIDECDYVISLPKLKTHNFTILTGAIKNLFGLVPDTYKTELHKRYFDHRDFSSVLVDIYEIVKPDLTIVDGVVALEGEGPGTSGSLRNLGLIFAGRDCVAIDSVLATVIGLKPENIYTTTEAARRGLGNISSEKIEVLGIQLKDVKAKPFKLPSGAPNLINNFPVFLAAKGLKKFITFYPRIDYKKCKSCRACFLACPAKAITIDNDRPVFDYKKCFSCFCCQEACPHAAIKTKKSFLARLVGL